MHRELSFVVKAVEQVCYSSSMVGSYCIVSTIRRSGLGRVQNTTRGESGTSRRQVYQPLSQRGSNPDSPYSVRTAGVP